MDNTYDPFELPAGIVGSAAEQISQIEGLMKSRKSRYWRGPEAANMQGYYRRLLEQRAQVAKAVMR